MDFFSSLKLGYKYKVPSAQPVFLVWSQPMSTLQVIGEKQEVVTEAIAGDYMGITCTATLCLVRDIPVLSETLSV